MSLRRAAPALATILALAAGPALAQGSFDFQALVDQAPHLAHLARRARESGVTFGIWGGTVRDLYLGRQFTPISDYDLVYDSSEPGFPAFRDELAAYVRAHRTEMPGPDFHMDLSPARGKSDRQVQLHSEGITATKVGVLQDGRILDPTGLGTRDLADRVLRFVAPGPRRRIELHNLGRFVRDAVRLADFRIEPATLDLLRSSLAAYADPADPAAAAARASAAQCRALARPGEPISFPALIRPFRQDLRRLHDQELDHLGPHFPADVFVFELFKTVTQAPDEASMRRVFSRLGVDRTLRALGLAREADLLMDPGLTRRDLFARFEFPGHRRAAASLPVGEAWEADLRRYSYRVLFDMLASDFPAGSNARARLAEAGADFMAPGSYATLNPGDDYRDELIAFLDTRFNDGTLDRAAVTRSLDWFLANYLPYGSATLAALEPPPGPPPRLRPPVREGFAPEVRAIARDEPHSMHDLRGYLELQLGRELLPRLLDPRTSHGYLEGSRDAAVAELLARGFPVVRQVNACGSSRRHRTLLGTDPERDRACLVRYGFDSREQLLNHQARLRFLAGPDGERIPAERVWTALDPAAPDSPDLDRLEAWLDARSAPVRVLVTGFTQPLKRLLTRPRTHDVGDLRLVVGELPGSGDGASVLGLSGFGASYGSLPARLARRLVPRGLKVLVYCGTAGGLAGPTARFQWVAPGTVALDGPGSGAPRGLAFENRAAALGLEPILAGVPHVTVATPLVETRAWVRDQRARGVASVDCELFHLVAELAARPDPPRIYALLNITDFPAGGTAEDRPSDGITTENSPLQQRRVRAALQRILLDCLPATGVSGRAPRPAAPRRSASSREPSPDPR